MERIDLGFQAKQVHRNLVGPNFQSLHLELDDAVEADGPWADEVAHPLAGIGVWPDGQPRAVARLTGREPLPSGPIRGTEVVKTCAKRVAAGATWTRDCAGRLGALGLGSQDLPLEPIEDREKQSWMLHAQER